jgi:hypothetical protein
MLGAWREYNNSWVILELPDKVGILDAMEHFEHVGFFDREFTKGRTRTNQQV